MTRELLCDLSRLSAASAALEPPKPARAASAHVDTKKNRKALFDACSSRDLAELGRLIDLGVPLSFCEADRDKKLSTPLSLCAAADWPQGLRALLAAGASEAEIPDFLDARHPQRPDTPLRESALERAARHRSAECFKILHPLYPADRQARAVATIREPAMYLAAESLGVAASIPAKSHRAMAIDWLHLLDPSHDGQPKAELARSAFDAASRNAGMASDPEGNNALWVHAVTRCSPAAVQALAARAIALPPGGLLSAIPKDHVSLRRSLKAWKRLQPSSWNPKHMQEQHTPEASVAVKAGLATVAAMQGSEASFGCAHALCAIPALRDELLEHPLGRHMLAHCDHLALLRRLGALGTDLASIRDEAGRNPLHTAAIRQASKADLEAIARICVDWISQRDEDGKIPSDFIDADRKQPMVMLFDKIGMRDALGGKRGPKTAPAKRKRL